MKMSFPNLTQEWQVMLPYLLFVVAGLTHLLDAVRQLKRKCRSFIYLKLLRFPTIILWRFAEFLVAGGLYLTVPKPSETTFVIARILFAITSGLGVSAILNADTEIGGYPIKIGTGHNLLMTILFSRIAERELTRTTLFWSKVEDEISRSQPEDLSKGWKFLSSYVARDPAINETQRSSTLNAIERVSKLTPAEQSKDLEVLIDVRRSNLPEILEQFGLSSEVVNGLVSS